MTAYKILQADSWDGKAEEWRQVWTEAGDVEAASAEQAVRAHARATPPDGSASYVAVPARSFSPITVTVETKTVLKLDGAE